MQTANGKLLQKNISRVFPNNTIAIAFEMLLLLLIGMLAVTIHAKLRIPMQLPGKHGIIFMALMFTSRSISRFPFAASLACMGASFLLYLNILGFKDPFMPGIYLLIGVLLDSAFYLAEKKYLNIIFLAIMGGICWMFIPLIREIFFVLTGFPYFSLMKGLVWPVSTHFIFGFLGILIGAGIIKLLQKK